MAVLGFAAYVAMEFYERHQAAEELAEETVENAIPPVSIVRAERSDPHQTITLPGNVAAWYQATIYAQVSGYVDAWYKDYGAQVHQGDVLARIRTPTLEAQHRQARADAAAQHARWDLAELTARRFTAMRASHAVAEQQISVKEAEARVARAEYEAAEQNVRNFEALLRFRTIVSPFDGVVTARNINVGDYVNKEGNLSEDDGQPGTNLFTVADIHRMRLFVSVPESFGPYLHEGLTADVTVPQFPDRHFEARFLTVANGFSTDTRTAVTEFVMENEDRLLWPGSYATVTISIDVDTPTLVVPATSLVFQERGTELAVVDDDNHVRFKRITVTQIRDGTIDVLEGITLEDRIIDNPSAALLEGDEVRIVTPVEGYQIRGSESSSGEGSHADADEDSEHTGADHDGDHHAPGDHGPAHAPADHAPAQMPQPAAHAGEAADDEPTGESDD